MKNRLPVSISIILVAVLGLASCAPVEGKVVTIPLGDGIPAYQVANDVLKSCRLPGGQNALVTRGTYWSTYIGNGASEVTDLQAVAIKNSGTCNELSDIVIEDSIINKLPRVTDPEQKQEIIDEFCNEGVLGTAEDVRIFQAMRDAGVEIGKIPFEIYCPELLEPQARK
jgi:hypothetical protein